MVFDISLDPTVKYNVFSGFVSIEFKRTAIKIIIQIFGTVFNNHENNLNNLFEGEKECVICAFYWCRIYF